MVNNTKFAFALLLFVVVLGTVSAVSADDSINQTSGNLQTSLQDNDDIPLTDDDVLCEDDEFEEDNISRMLSLSQTGGLYGETKLQVSLTNLDTGDGLEGEEIYFYVNRVFWKSFKTDSNGKISINFNKNPGDYFVEAKYDNFDELKSYVFFSISGIPSYLSVKQTGAYYKDTKLIITLKNNMNGKPLSNEELSLKFSNGKSATVKTNSKGQATYNVPFNPGKYSVTVKTKSKYLNKNEVKLNNFIIAKTYLNLYPTKLSTTYGSGKCFKVKVTNMFTKHTMSGVKLKLKVYTGNNFKTVSVTTDSNGVAKYDGSKLSVGTHKVVVNNANSNMVGYEKTSSIKISKAALTISAPKLTKMFDSSKKFTVTVKNKESGKVMSGIKVSLKVWTNSKYKSYSLKTNSKGVVSIDTNSLTKTAHKVNIAIKSDSKINSKTASSQITIKDKTKTYLNESLLNVTDDGVIISPRLIDSNGKVLNKSVDVLYLNNTVKAYSNETILLNDTAFSHVLIRFLEDSQYYGCEFEIDL